MRVLDQGRDGGEREEVRYETCGGGGEVAGLVVMTPSLVKP